MIRKIFTINFLNRNLAIGALRRAVFALEWCVWARGHLGVGVPTTAVVDGGVGIVVARLGVGATRPIGDARAIVDGGGRIEIERFHFGASALDGSARAVVNHRGRIIVGRFGVSASFLLIGVAARTGIVSVGLIVIVDGVLVRASITARRAAVPAGHGGVRIECVRVGVHAANDARRLRIGIAARCRVARIGVGREHRQITSAQHTAFARRRTHGVQYRLHDTGRILSSLGLSAQSGLT